MVEKESISAMSDFLKNTLEQDASTARLRRGRI